jgi:hypothetical protein
VGQLGFIDLNRRYEGLNEKSDPLVAIAALVPFESFRPKLKAALIKGELRGAHESLFMGRGHKVYLRWHGDGRLAKDWENLNGKGLAFCASLNPPHAQKAL